MARRTMTMLLMVLSVGCTLPPPPLTLEEALTKHGALTVVTSGPDQCVLRDSAGVYLTVSGPDTWAIQMNYQVGETIE